MKEYSLGPNNEILDGFRGSDPKTKPLQHVFINLDLLILYFNVKFAKMAFVFHYVMCQFK